MGNTKEAVTGFSVPVCRKMHSVCDLGRVDSNYLSMSLRKKRLCTRIQCFEFWGKVSLTWWKTSIGKQVKQDLETYIVDLKLDELSKYLWGNNTKKEAVLEPIETQLKDLEDILLSAQRCICKLFSFFRTLSEHVYCARTY